MSNRILAAFLCLVLAVPYASKAEIDNRAIIKIFVTATPCNPDRPWSPDSPQEASGTGFIIEGQRIMTNAHVVQYATFIMVKRGGDSKQYRAEVIYVSHQADLALLSVQDESFFEGVNPFKIGVRPKLRDEITVVGYPTGGEELSYTSGIVSRIEVNSYAHSNFQLLTLQVDAAMNPGNSGGPAFHGEQIVGVAMMGAPDADGVGYLIPPEIIEHFLQDIEDGSVDGFPSLPIRTLGLENKMQRRFYGVEKEGKLGMVIYAVDFELEAQCDLRSKDIITAIDGVPVYANRKIHLGSELLLYTHLISSKQVGELVELSILRDGNKRRVSIKATCTPDLLPFRCHSVDYPYFLFGGYVFTPLYYDFIRTYGESWPDPSLYSFSSGKVRKSNRRQIVFLHTILKHELTNSIPVRWLVVKSINGTLVQDFPHLVALMNGAMGWVDVEFESGSHLNLNAEQCRALEEEIMALYNIPRRTKS